MSIELKIKSKHLAEEAKIIRFEERKLNNRVKWLRNNQKPTGNLENKLESLTNHRRWNVRNENRSTFLARAFIKGIPYESVERNINNRDELVTYIVPRVSAMVQKYYSRNASNNDILRWING